MKILPKPKSLQHDFTPPWWARGAHLQTIASAILPLAKLPALHRERIETPDGDFLDIDYLHGDIKAPRVVLLHGLEGSSDSPYIRSMLIELQKRGWNAAAVNFRGCSGEDNRLHTSYHAGKTDDLDTILEETVHKQGSPAYIIGYSLGGNILLKWLGERGPSAASYVKRAAAVSVPYNLTQSVCELDQGFNKAVYTRLMLAGLKSKAARKGKKFPQFFSKRIIQRYSTFAEFDHEVTARINGFQSAQHYWQTCSAQNFLPQIRIPTLLIHAEDDPFFPGRHFPYEALEKSGHVELFMTKRGGHLGFLGGSVPWSRKFWLEHQILNYFV